VLGDAVLLPADGGDPGDQCAYRPRDRAGHCRHGLLAVPVLAGSGAYALGEALGWTTGLDRQPLDAKAFYGTIAVSTLIGILINFIGLDPIKALFWSAVINGVVAVPLMVIIMLLAMRHDVMGHFVLPRALWAMGWFCNRSDGGRGRYHVCHVVGQSDEAVGVLPVTGSNTSRAVGTPWSDDAIGTQRYRSALD
jgi:Natural resistance-associated macrophage protein